MCVDISTYIPFCCVLFQIFFYTLCVGVCGRAMPTVWGDVGMKEIFTFYSILLDLVFLRNKEHAYFCNKSLKN